MTLPAPPPAAAPAAGDPAGAPAGAFAEARAGAPAEARAGALEQVIAAAERPLWRFLMRYLGDEEIARDLAQETFVRALAGRRTFRGDAALRTWLFRIGRNLAVSHLRRQGRERPIAPGAAATPEPAAAGPDAGDRADLARLRAAVDRLPPRQREVVELRCYQDLGFPDVGRVLGITALAARVSYHFALRRLRKELGTP